MKVEEYYNSKGIVTFSNNELDIIEDYISEYHKNSDFFYDEEYHTILGILEEIRVDNKVSPLSLLTNNSLNKAWKYRYIFDSVVYWVKHNGDINYKLLSKFKKALFNYNYLFECNDYEYLLRNHIVTETNIFTMNRVNPYLHYYLFELDEIKALLIVFKQMIINRVNNNEQVSATFYRIYNSIVKHYNRLIKLDNKENN